MIRLLSVPPIVFLLTLGALGLPTVARANEPAQSSKEKSAEERTQNIDCAQQVWPHISPSCLRNADDKIEVRLLTITRR